MSTADHSDGTEREVGAPINQQIAAFRQRLAREFARYPDFDRLPPAEARRIADALRGPLTEGGPNMSATLEQQVIIDGCALRIRVHYPSEQRDVPALVYLHGGGWTFFSIDTHDRIMREYAARTGIAVIGVDYPLSPECKFPFALDRIAGLLRWLHHAGAAAFGIDGQRLAIGGDSAGGNLAMAVALVMRESGAPKLLQALVLNYGVFDSSLAGDSYRVYGAEGNMLTRSEMARFWDNYVARESDRQQPLACLSRADVAHLPPTYLAIAECDPLYDENIAMARQLEAAGVPTRSVVYPGTIHSFLEAVATAEVAERAFADQAEWLRTTLGWPA